ncbi:cytochrome P450 [Actinosynnema sp. NPDC047251]|uniref:Cytochrome P450 family protein n=1 Tax=Saccharothrix espanaensis (strain ATCC 51144 / DSM 44229 / JCM 9112 / NBRC 15066 / NRRL 15764) TaxID=1179773 RepID=K0K0Y5_SACES|nr:cytochrome P450 [Saccharothrix espanaensis]CCH31202.1 Cytochrome P450 family protein [Saccharothrix espanaensis DSM 44229]
MEATEQATCPVRDYTTLRPPAPAMTAFEEMDEHRAHARPALHTEDAQGYRVFTDHDAVADGLRQADLWSSSAVFPFEPEPDRVMVPIQLDGDRHTAWRRLLAAWFTPGRVRAMRDDQRRLAASTVDGVRPRGECDFLADVAKVFTSAAFLPIMGVAPEDVGRFLEWTDGLHFRGDDPEQARKTQQTAAAEMTGYLGELLERCRRHPDPARTDIVAAAACWRIDGVPPSDEDLVNCLMTVLGAALETTASQLTWTAFHLATHPDDRLRLVRDPSLVPGMVEEGMRVYPIATPTRKATRDAEFQGCPVRAGDVAVFSLAAAGRDERAYRHATEVDLDRRGARHLSFGAGRHTCLGAHLARQEMALLLQEWHRLIPDYELAKAPQERATMIWSLDELRLRWG